MREHAQAMRRGRRTIHWSRVVCAVFAAALLTPGTTPAAGQGVPTGFLDRTITVDGAQHRYQVYVPRDYTASRDWPVILFLHGAGERGDDGLFQTQVGIGEAIRRDVGSWPAIVVMPQVPLEQRWTGRAGDVAMAALDATVEEYSIDEDRTYLTGLSMGGQGSWYLGWRYPERWAAVAPICGFVRGLGERWEPFVQPPADPVATVAERMASLPVWVFHGGADPVVPVEESRLLVAALEALDADVHYTEFEGVGHDSWVPAYALDEFVEWLFEQRRRP